MEGKTNVGKASNLNEATPRIVLLETERNEAKRSKTERTTNSWKENGGKD